MLSYDTSKEKFSEIYNSNLWGSVESRSGEGSEIGYTEPLRKWLIEKINSLDIKTVVDAACGDLNWMKLVLREVEVNYIKLDIVEEVIEGNNLAYGSDRIEFGVANICEDKLQDCDLIIVRDCLFHLSYDDINSFLFNLSKTNYKYLLTTTHIVDLEFKNSDISTGYHRLIDLFKDPFNFDVDHVKDRVADFPEGYQTKREMIIVEKKFVPIHLAKVALN